MTLVLIVSFICKDKKQAISSFNFLRLISSKTRRHRKMFWKQNDFLTLLSIFDEILHLLRHLHSNERSGCFKHLCGEAADANSEASQITVVFFKDR